MARLLE
jgi:hypothetical protein